MTDPAASRAIPARVVIDTDAANEIDDQFALAWALLAPECIDLLEVHAAPFSHGSYFAALAAATEARGGTPATAFEAMAADLGPAGIEQLTAKRSPGAGMQRSIHEIGRVLAAAGVGPNITRPDAVAGADRFMTSEDDAVDSPAARRLIELAHASPEPLHVPMLGAATNVASALVIDPSIAERIVPIFVAGYPTGTPHVDDSFNLVQDRHATNRLFRSAPNLVYIPGYQVAAVLTVSLPELDRHAAGRGQLGDLLVQLYRDNPLAASPTSPGHSWVLWDLAPIAWLIDRNWVPTHETRAAKVTADHRWQQRAGSLTEAFRVDGRAVFTDFFARIDAHGADRPHPR